MRAAAFILAYLLGCAAVVGACALAGVPGDGTGLVALVALVLAPVVAIVVMDS